MAGLSLYGRGQDAPRQSGSEPWPYPGVARSASKHDMGRERT